MRYDFVIVGGGLVGAGLALALRKSNLRIALIDARLPSSNDPRLLALNSSSCQFLKNLGIWPNLQAHAAPIQQVHVSRRGHFGTVRLSSDDINLPELGHVIPAYIIEAALNAELDLINDVTFHRPAKLKKIIQQSDQVDLVLDTEAGEKNLHATIVIGADGAESTVRTQFNIPTEIIEYDQSAIVTRTTLQRAHQHIAYERFNKTGAIAMLPLIGEECATIWSGENKIISELIKLSDNDFLQALQKEFGYRLGRLKNISQRHVFPLRMIQAKQTIAQNVFLLGNSAHTLHPIAAQGLNLALYEVAVLVEMVMNSLAKKGSFTVDDLQAINQRMQTQQAASIRLSQELLRWFSKDSTLINMALQFGMLGFDIFTPAKRKFIARMLGRIGHVPDLLLSKIYHE